MSDALSRMVAQLMANSDNETEDKPPALPTVEGQRELLRHFRQGPELQVGDEVQRNAQGKLRYRFPLDKQVAVVTRVFPGVVLDEDGKTCTGELGMVVSPKGAINVYPVDLRYYERVAEFTTGEE